MFLSLLTYYNVKSFPIKSKLVKHSYSTIHQTLTIQDVDGIHRKVNYFDSGCSDVDKSNLPPLIILPGTAQCIQTFQPHINVFSRYTRTLILELRCQGQTELLSEYSNTQQHVDDFCSILAELNIKSCCVVGFSFGGRIGLAIAALKRNLIQKLSVTGVPLTRSALGKSILKSWMIGLQEGNMKSTAWSFVLNGFSEKFLDRVDMDKKLEVYVESVIESNNPKHLLDLIKYGNFPESLDAVNCAELIQCSVQVIGSTDDRISSIDSVKQLSLAIPLSQFIEMEGGHLLPFESPKMWRDAVLEFMLN